MNQQVQASQAQTGREGGDETTIQAGFALPNNSDTTTQNPNDPDNPSNPEGDKSEVTPEPKETVSNGDAKKRRIADKKAKETREKAEKFDRLLAAISPSEGEEGDGEESDPLELTLSRIDQLERRAELAEWERDNRPKNLTEEGEKTWKEALENKSDPEHPYHKLSFDDLWKLASPQTDSSNPKVQEVEKQIKIQEDQPFAGSVPLSSSPQVNSDELTDLDKKIAAEMNWSEDDYKSAGVLN